MPIPTYSLMDAHTKEPVLLIAAIDNASHCQQPQRFNHFSMLLLSEGEGAVVRDGATYSFEAPCLLSFSIYQPFSVTSDDRLEGVVVNFHPSFFCLFKHRNEVSCNGVLFNNLYDSPEVKLAAADLQSLNIIVDQMRTELRDRQTPDVDMLLSYLKIFLITASRAKISQRQDHEAGIYKTPAMADQLRSAIEANFRTLHTPADYSGLLHLSTKSLNRIARETFNKTLTGLIAERLIIEAKRELYLTAKSVKEIAYELGYDDEFYFSRYFKNKVGVSPQKFRDKVGFDKLSDQ